MLETDYHHYMGESKMVMLRVPTMETGQKKTKALKVSTKTANDLQDLAEVEGKEPWEILDELLVVSLPARLQRHSKELNEIKKLKAAQRAVIEKARERSSAKSE
jgi:hypothetical protein